MTIDGTFHTKKSIQQQKLTKPVSLTNFMYAMCIVPPTKLTGECG